MNIRFLETFLWVARLKSFRLTAEKLFTTQASISHRIAGLEEELGVKLFVRESRGVVLTPDGQRVREYAERIVSQSYALRQAMGAARDGRGKVRLGVIDSVVYTWFTELIARISARFPNLEVEVTADSGRNLSNQLQKGYLDIAFQVDPVRLESVNNLELVRYPLQWIVASGSSLHHAYDSLASLAHHRIITFVAHSRPHQDIVSLLNLHGIDSPRITCVNSFAAMIRMIEEGFGIGVIPPALVTEQLASGRLAILGIDDLSDNCLSMISQVASWRTGPGLECCGEIAQLAHQVVQEFCRKMGPDYARPARR